MIIEENATNVTRAIESILVDMAGIEPQADTLDCILTALCERLSKNDMSGLFCKYSSYDGDCGFCRYKGKCADGLKQNYLSKGKQDNESVCN